MPSHSETLSPLTEARRRIVDVTHTTCCIVGGGPAGVVLAYMLARRGIAVSLLEEHLDFDRDFRGDTLQPGAMELMDELGLADQLLQLRHAKLRVVTAETSSGPVTLYDCGLLRTKFQFSTELPQVLFLDYITTQAKRYQNFVLQMGAHVQELIVEAGAVRGVRYRARDGWHEVRAGLTIGADGRFSRLRHLAGLKPVKTAPDIDVVWFRVPRRPDETEDPFLQLGGGRFVFGYAYPEHWRVAYVIPKGAYQRLRASGLETLKQSVIDLAPRLADRMQHVQDWRQAPLLSVEANRLKRWYRPGLLLIGDAAHAMSPVCGVGTTYAIQDAVVAANVLCGPLERGQLRVSDLAEVQRRRHWPLRVIQSFQAQVQRRMVASAIVDEADRAAPPPPAVLRLPIVLRLVTHLIAFGIWRVHVEV
jgi:2-polyprenyl-6-methoxyphenol hydroxylase-like FAD-dependent oxidoreductase